MIKVLIISFFCTLSWQMIEAQYNVKTFGARGDGISMDTRFIQQAIDSAFRNGGGKVDVPAGTYKVGTLILKSNIELHLDPGATLSGSRDYTDYTSVNQKFESRAKDLYAKYFMIFAENEINISITGFGTIYGNGLKNYLQTYPQNLRPMMVRLVNCVRVNIRDVQLLESANWTLHLLGCKEVNIDGIRIETRGEGNRDGLDIDGCQKVKISNSAFSTTDDAIVMKSTCDSICSDISIVNCIISTNGSAVKTGTESNGGFRNITVSNCIFKDVPIHAGIELITVDGGMLQNVLIENIAMENVATPIFIKIGIRSRSYKEQQYVNKIEEVKDISINQVSVVNAKLPSSIIGLDNKKIKNITISDYSVRYKETQKSVRYNEVPREEFSYPMALMYKNLPAYGFYCRNVEDLHFRNLSMYSMNNEKRAALAFDKIDGLELFSVQADVKDKAVPMVHLRNAKNVSASLCRTAGVNHTIFELEDKTCVNIFLFGNMIQSGQKEVVRVKDLPSGPDFEDFHTDIKYSINEDKKFKGIFSYALKENPLDFSLNITQKGVTQLCLLMLNDSKKAENVLLKYNGVVQHFVIDWNEWGWAPISLLNQYNQNEVVKFEIAPQQKESNLRFAKAYLRYQNIEKTD